VKDGSTTDDGLFTVEAVECIARAPRRPRCRSTTATATASRPSSLETSSGSARRTLSEEIPPHGTLARVRQRTPANWTGIGKAAQEKVDAL
jgi:hypothetical protein